MQDKTNMTPKSQIQIYMKQKFLLIMLLLFSGAGTFHLHAQTALTVSLQDGTQQSYSLTDLRKITFSNGNMLLTKTDASENTFAMNTVEKSFFNASSSIEENISNEAQNVTVYPNPATDIIYVNTGFEGAAKVQIYSLDGSLVLSTQISASGEAIDVSRLSSGLYIIKVNNQVSKFRKL